MDFVFARAKGRKSDDGWKWKKEREKNTSLQVTTVSGDQSDALHFQPALPDIEIKDLHYFSFILHLT